MFGPAFQGRIEQSKNKVLKKFKTLALVAMDQSVGVVWFFPLYFLSFELAESLCYWRGFSLLNVGRRLKCDLASILIAQVR